MRAETGSDEAGANGQKRLSERYQPFDIGRNEPAAVHSKR